MPSIYFNEKQLEVISELCNTWFSNLDGSSEETEMILGEFSETVSEISEKVSRSISAEISKREMKSVIEKAYEIAGIEK